MSKSDFTGFNSWVASATADIALSIGLQTHSPNKALRHQNPQETVPSAPDHSTRSRAVICCVYFLMDGDSVIYVGQSRNFYRRIAHHLGNPSMNFSHFVVTECLPEHLDRLEARFIHEFDPKMNTVIPAFNYKKYRRRK